MQRISVDISDTTSRCGRNKITQTVNTDGTKYRIFRPITCTLSIQKGSKIVKTNMRGIR